MAVNFSLSLVESSCFAIFFICSSDKSWYSELELRDMARSRVCSEKLSESRMPNLEAFSVSDVKFMTLIVVRSTKRDV